jgi:hypothetical protein
MAKTIEILIPTAEPRAERVAVNPHVHDLNGKIVGFLWDEKPNGDFLLNRIKEKLLERYNLAGTIWRQVGGLHIGAEDAAEIQQLADACDTVIVAVGD